MTRRVNLDRWQPHVDEATSSGRVPQGVCGRTRGRLSRPSPDVGYRQSRTVEGPTQSTAPQPGRAVRTPKVGSAAVADAQTPRAAGFSTPLESGRLP